jgi:hypothetical protein
LRPSCGNHLEVLALVEVHSFSCRTKHGITCQAFLIPALEVSVETLEIELTVRAKRRGYGKHHAAEMGRRKP